MWKSKKYIFAEYVWIQKNIKKVNKYESIKNDKKYKDIKKNKYIYIYTY